MIGGILGFLFTIAVYWFAKRLYRAKPILLFSPLLFTPVVLVCLLLGTHTAYESYNAGGKWLAYMLQPATIAFAVPLSFIEETRGANPGQCPVWLCRGRCVLRFIGTAYARR